MILLHYVCYICNKCIGMFQLFFGVFYVGPGARLVVSLEGWGARLWRHPGSNYLGYTPNGHLV